MTTPRLDVALLVSDPRQQAVGSEVLGIGGQHCLQVRGRFLAPFESVQRLSEFSVCESEPSQIERRADIVRYRRSGSAARFVGQQRIASDQVRDSEGAQSRTRVRRELVGLPLAGDQLKLRSGQVVSGRARRGAAQDKLLVLPGDFSVHYPPDDGPGLSRRGPSSYGLAPRR